MGCTDSLQKDIINPQKKMDPNDLNIIIEENTEDLDPVEEYAYQPKKKFSLIDHIPPIPQCL